MHRWLGSSSFAGFLQAIVTGIVSAYSWSFGHLLQVIDPGALPTSSWYTYLFLCYGVGRLLTAVSLVLVARRKRSLEG